MVCITGQVPTPLIGSDAFQEGDTVGSPVRAPSTTISSRSVADLPRVLHEAFYIANSGRPGPVLVDIPKDVQFAMGTYYGPTEIDTKRHKSYRPQVEGDTRLIEAAVDLDAARRAADPLYGRRHRECRAGGEQAARARRTHGLPGDLDADGARHDRPARRHSGSAWSACTAPTSPTWRCTTAT